MSEDIIAALLLTPIFVGAGLVLIGLGLDIILSVLSDWNQK